MARTFDLEKESRAFKNELDELLNRTICSGISLKSILTSTSPQRTIVGYKITRDNQDLTEGIPITTGQDPRFYLGLSVRMAPDQAQTFLMVTSSVMILAIAPDVADESNLLLHYDYERGKADYPEAHLQICASSPAWKKAGQRLDGRERLLERLHLPVGGRRYRPTLEDIIEFLITEKLAKPLDGWETAINESRDRFRNKQLRAAVRRDPESAIAVLKSLDYTVKPPKK